MAKSNNGKTAKLKVIVKNYNLIFDDNNFLVTNGTKIVKKNNNKQVLLRGFNLGVWLSRSLAFMPVVPLANTKEELNSKGYSCINSESFMQALSKNPSVGSSGANKLSKILYDNFITEADLDLISNTIYFNDLLTLSKAVLNSLHINNNLAQINANGYFLSNAHFKTNFKKVKSKGAIVVRNGKLENHLS